NARTTDRCHVSAAEPRHTHPRSRRTSPNAHTATSLQNQRDGDARAQTGPTNDTRRPHTTHAHNPGPSNDTRHARARPRTHERRTPAPRTPSTPNRTYPPPAAHCPPPIFGGRWASATRRHAHLPPARRRGAGGAHTRPPPAPHCPSSAGGGA
ncbi:hypothetical protein DXG01_015504, partial [Tephrocybe rancida]